MTGRSFFIKWEWRFSLRKTASLYTISKQNKPYILILNAQVKQIYAIEDVFWSASLKLDSKFQIIESSAFCD
jgi:hypothetical protein